MPLDKGLFIGFYLTLNTLLCVHICLVHCTNIVYNDFQLSLNSQNGEEKSPKNVRKKWNQLKINAKLERKEAGNL